MYSDYTEDNENYYADDDNNSRFDKEKLKRIVFFVLVFVILIILIIIFAKGCSKKNNNDISINDKIPTVVVGKHSISLNVGESEQLYSDVLNSSLDDVVVAWYSEDTSVASVNEGYITAEGEGQTNIVALYRENGNVYQDKCLITVTSNIVHPESIDLGQEEMTVKLGETVLLQVSIIPVEAKISDLVFESEAPEIVSVDENGYITAEGVGTTAIIVKSQDETVASSIIVTVTETGSTEINPTNLTIIGLSNGLTVGSTAEIIYNLSPSNATNNLLTWTSSDPSVATVENGVVTANKVGTCTIIGTTANGISSKLDITIESNNIPVSSISINGDTSVTIPLGGTRLLSYTISPDNATNKNVTYTTSNSSVVFIDSNGIMAGIGVGTSVVSITTEDSNKTALINVTVTSSDNSVTPSPGTNPSDDGSSSGSSDGGSSSSSSSSTTPSSSTIACNVNSFTIKSNQSSAVTSNLRFENTQPFTNSNPGFIIQTFDDCLKKVSYSLWYNSDVSKLNTSLSPNETGTITRTQGTFYFSKNNNNKNGYYYIKLVVETNDNQTYYKYYYARVNISSSSSASDSSDYIKVTPLTSVKNGNNLTITKYKSDVTKVYYCITTSGSDCVVEGTTSSVVYRNYINFSSKNIGDTYTKQMYYRTSINGNPTINYGRKICFQAYTNKLVGSKMCREITT